MHGRFANRRCAAPGLAALVLAAGAAAADEIERSFEVGADGLLELRSDVGSIDVQSHAANRVDVRVERLTKDSEALEVEFSQEGSTVRISGDLASRQSGHYRVRYELRVPRGFSLELDTAGGAISVEDLDGRVSARTAGGALTFGRMGGAVFGRTAGGSILLQDSAGEADLSTAGGSVEVGDVGGQVRVRTAGGSIRIGRVEGSVEADTAGGSIRIEEAVGAVRASTSGGSIRAYISRQPSADSELETSGGSITVFLAEGIALDVDAHGGDTGVHSDFPVDGRTEAEHRLRGALNGGGPRLYLRATGGVDIERR
jgi:hypothetical protein